jgi:hypothetical protein
MRILLDTCVWPGVGDTLRAAGHDVESTAAWPLDPGDEEILAYASAEGACSSRSIRTSESWLSFADSRTVGSSGSSITGHPSKRRSARRF